MITSAAIVSMSGLFCVCVAGNLHQVGQEVSQRNRRGFIVGFQNKIVPMKIAT